MSTETLVTDEGYCINTISHSDNGTDYIVSRNLGPVIGMFTLRINPIDDTVITVVLGQDILDGNVVVGDSSIIELDGGRRIGVNCVYQWLPTQGSDIPGDITLGKLLQEAIGRCSSYAGGVETLYPMSVGIIERKVEDGMINYVVGDVVFFKSPAK